MVPIECRGCFKQTGQLKLFGFDTIRSYMKGRSKWDELCRECAKMRGPSNKISYRKIGNSTEFFFPAEMDRPVRIVYGRCRHEREVSRVTVKGNILRWPAICPNCKRDPEAYRVRMQELAEKRSFSGSQKKPGRTPTITEERIRDAYKKLGDFAPQEKLAEALGVDARAIRDWQSARGLTYPQLRQQFASTGSN
jgi:hypothetical protein